MDVFFGRPLFGVGLPKGKPTGKPDILEVSLFRYMKHVDIYLSEMTFNRKFNCVSWKFAKVPQRTDVRKLWESA